MEKEYEVYGIIRRSSTFNTSRIDHIFKDPHERNVRLHLIHGDLDDSSTVNRIIREIMPDEIYNLGAQSHVRVSFDIPEYTGNVTALGALRILEAIHRIEQEGGKKIKFYQASSSEMFGKVQEVPQSENTPFYPRSPYGIAKVYSYWITKNYREAYNIFACNGVLFNHETISSFMPMFYNNKNEEEFDIKPISEIVEFNEDKRQYQSKKVFDIQVWGKEGWVDVTHASAYPHNIKEDNKYPRFINSRSGAFMATSSHVVFMKDGKEKEVGKTQVGDCVELIKFPKPLANCQISLEEAELIGMLVGDGSISYAKTGISLNGKFTNSSQEIREHFDRLWLKVTGGKTNYYPSKSGFNPKKIVGQLRLIGGNSWLRKIDIYNKDKTKRIPRIILNSSTAIMKAFLKGYNLTDGLKSNPCVYEFRNFKTNSATLAMGLWFLVENTTKQEINLSLELKEDGRIFYSLNMLSTVDNASKEREIKELIAKNFSQRKISRETKISRTFIRKIQRGGSHCVIHHLRKNPFEIKKIIDIPEYEGWFYDLETSSGEFHCGVGKCHVHNSPRRGETFVTKKITRAVVRIKESVQDCLYLGNLDAKRDWGHARDYIEAMWMMMQQENPGDYVIATGKNYSVREFLEMAFKEVGIEIISNGKKGVEEEYIRKDNGQVVVKIDPRYFRPTEVDILLGDYSKAKKELGWEPKISFEQLVKEMIEHDMKELQLELYGTRGDNGH